MRWNWVGDAWEWAGAVFWAVWLAGLMCTVLAGLGVLP